MEMWNLRGISFLTIVAVALCQLASDEEMRSSKQLKLMEIRQVMSDRDPTGVDHDIKVIVSPHDPFQNIVAWELFLQNNNGQTAKYSTKGDGSNPTTQTEFLFEGKWIECNSILVMARNETKPVAAGLLSGKFESDLGTEAVWVGEDRGGNDPSLRVRLGNLVNKAEVNDVICDTDQSPCYFIEPTPKPTTVGRCYNPLSDTEFKQCDDRILPFKEPSSIPAVILNGTTLEIEDSSNDERHIFEVVAYDPQDNTNVFSEERYKCVFPIGHGMQQDGKYKCWQKLNLPEGQEDLMVLIVKLNEGGSVAESSLQVIGESPSPSPGASPGVVVGSIFGTLIGIALIVFLVVICMRQKDKKNLKTDRGGSAVYAPTTTTDPEEPQTTISTQA